MVPGNTKLLLKKVVLYLVMLGVSYALADILTTFTLGFMQALSGQGGWTPTDHDQSQTFSYNLGKIFMGTLVARFIFLLVGKEHPQAKQHSRALLFCLLSIPISLLLAILSTGTNSNLIYGIATSLFIGSFGLFSGYVISKFSNIERVK